MFFSCSVTQKRIILVTFLGAVTGSICLLLPFRVYLRLILGAILVGTMSVGMLFPKTNGIKVYIKYLLTALWLSVLLGGTIALLQKWIWKREFTIIEMIPVTLGIFFMLRVMLRRHLLTKQKLYYQVMLLWEGKEYPMNALLDTGNGLIEPISKKAVCLVGKEYFEQKWVKEGERNYFQPQKFRAIPYHAVGTPKGILSGYEMDRLIIYTDERKVEIQKPMIGISEHSVGTPETYQMILQPKLLREGVK